MNKKDIRNISIIIGLILIYIISNFLLGNSYISYVDYISQHFRISEYLRELFYTNFNLFPSFAFNLGGGQNIFYLAYHGLLSPITLLSYLFPFIKMQDFIVVSNIILLFLSIIFFYIWLKPKFDTKVTFTSTFIFAFSGPLIYHTHRHIMFNNYMLFLILSLIFVDWYFDKGKKSPLILMIFLIIMTSFYYSVLSIICICIYALYKYLSVNNKVNFKDILKEGFKFIGLIIIPIMMACILLLPTIYAIKNGRSDTLSNINLLDILIPKFDIDTFFYKSYSVGLSCILIYSIINLFLNKKRCDIFLAIISIIILVFPIVCYSLNGFMYLDGKCFIPLLPLFVFIIAKFLDNIKDKNYNYKLLLTITYIVMLIIGFTNLSYKYLFIFVIDNACLFIGLMLYKYRNNYNLLQYPVIIFSIISCFIINTNDRLVKIDDLKKINNINDVSINYDNNYRVANLFNILENVNNVKTSDYRTTSIYSSLENKYYTNFVRNVFKNEIYNKDYHTITNSNNILFNMYMGNLYLIKDYDIIGYDKVSNNVYKNDDVFSIGYSSNSLMSKSYFDTLDYPYSIDALMKYTIVKDEGYNNYDNSDVIKYNGNIALIDTNIGYIDNNKTYSFDVIDKGYARIRLDDDVSDKILIVTLDMDYNDKKDTSITINNTINTLSYKNWKYHNNNYTFHYVLSNTNEFDINISKGHYEISNINIYVLDYDNYKNLNKDHDLFNIMETDNKIKGNINVKNDGYFTLSIPYDKGFNIKVDNNYIDYELVNTSFIGFRINKGYHDIEITYNPPYAKLGSFISLIGVIIYIVFIWRDVNEKN